MNTEKVIDQDIFGYKFNMNLNGHHETYKTLCGGVSSLVIKVLIFW